MKNDFKETRNIILYPLKAH